MTKPPFIASILLLHRNTGSCRRTQKYQEQQRWATKKTVSMSEGYPQSRLSRLYPAGWLAWVFSKAQQQVENRPAMLQNTLSIDNANSLQVFAARGNCFNYIYTEFQKQHDWCIWPTCVWSFLCSSENRAASDSLLCFNTAAKQRSVMVWTLKIRALLTQCASCVKTALLHNRKLDSKSPFLNFNRQSQSVPRKATILLNKEACHPITKRKQSLFSFGLEIWSLKLQSVSGAGIFTVLTWNKQILNSTVVHCSV